MTNRKVVQFKATQKAQSKLEQLKKRLRTQGTKPSIELILNAILENIHLSDFDKMTKGVIEANSIKNQLLEMFNDGRINKEMLDELMKNQEKNTN
uniref:Uncharacterized protein n=1 Tax=Pectobacterium carotovorum TaxID=554 RepID=A0A0K0MNQ6_PECCA|nr:hypothetical protein [Pectobacterium carotovorum]AKG47455.1 hypothetical protein pA_00015 [Pectobacterium carotovorum]